MIFLQTNKSTHLQSTCKLVAVFMVTVFASVLSFAQNASAESNSLIDISHITLQNNQQQLAFTLSGPVPEPRSFSIDNPARIAIDLPGTGNDLTDRTIGIGAGLIQDVTTVEAGGRTRIVVNLASMIPYHTAIAGNQLLVTFNDPANNLADAGSITNNVQGTVGVPQTHLEPVIGAAQSGDVTTSIVAAQDVTSHAIESVDFRRGPTGEGRVIFQLSGAGINPDMREEGGRIIVEFANTQLPDSLKKRLDVSDFGTPVSHIDARANRRGTRVVIQPATEFFEHLAYQSDDQFTVELKPMTKDELEDAQKKKFGYVGEKLSLNFQDIEVRSVLQLLADFTDLNIVVSDTVQGLSLIHI